MPFLRQLEKKAYHKITLKGGEDMTNYLRKMINSISNDLDKKLTYAIMIDKFNKLKKQGVIDETLYTTIEKALRRKYKIK